MLKTLNVPSSAHVANLFAETPEYIASPQSSFVV